MQKSIIIFLLVLCNFFALAQKTKPPVYFYTPASKVYLSDTTIDSLFYITSARLFEQSGIPKALFEEKYPTIKPMLTMMSKAGIVQSFKTIETKKATPVKTLQQVAAAKQVYIDAFIKQVEKTYQSNKVLSLYLSFNNSDRITYFNSTVRVNKDGTLLVQEKITVHNGNGQPNIMYGNSAVLKEAGANNNEIQRGIVRAFPLYYVNKYKLFQNTTFKLKEVLKDGQKENYHTENKDNGILVYTGSREVFLDAGNYTYTITYETDKQLKFLNNYDELYWNVTGTGWSFKIDSATCTVILPGGATPLSSKCYTGAQDEKGEDGTIETHTIGDSTIIVFKTTKALLPYHGITVATSWPKGFVTAPAAWQQLKYFIWSNKAVFLLPFAALFSALFCFFFWFKYGRDPKKGVVYPLFEPPAGFPPAALGYIYNQKFDRQLTAATIVDAAVRNKIKVDVEREGWIIKHNEYVISKSEVAPKPPVSKYEEFENYIEDLIDTSIEKGKYNSELGSLNTKLQSYCTENYKNKDGWAKKKDKGFFALNSSYTVLPILVCIAAAAWGFFGGLVDAIKVKNFGQIGYFIGGIILCYIVLTIFNRLLPAYNRAGRELTDKIAGFRMFLATADEHRFDIMNPPKKSLELYEKYLPFAIALGCEIQWGKKFEEIINSAYLSKDVGHSFTQSFTNSTTSNIGSSFASSFSGAITSASTPPSSSSGGGSSFGGGSSGGGGGGGGGGGW